MFLNKHLCRGDSHADWVSRLVCFNLRRCAAHVFFWFLGLTRHEHAANSYTHPCSECTLSFPCRAETGECYGIHISGSEVQIVFARLSDVPHRVVSFWDHTDGRHWSVPFVLHNIDLETCPQQVLVNAELSSNSITRNSSQSFLPCHKFRPDDHSSHLLIM